MTLRGLLLILAASTIALAGKQYMQPSGENPGTCPNDVINTCFCRPGLKGCKNDNECPYSLKCCSDRCGCRRVCRTPDLQTRAFLLCFYYGKLYIQGQTFPCIDGCNTCTCRGNNNVISTYIDCSAICREPQDVGPCSDYTVRWWYNRATNRCQQFVYGGCLGNENNFETERACLQRCRR